MPRPCSVCIHTKRDKIEQAVMRGETYRRISTLFDVSTEALRRHKKNGHIGKEIIEARQVEIVERSGEVWAQIDFWSGEIEAIYREARQKHEKSVALTAIDKAMKLVALTSQIRAMSGEGPGEVAIDWYAAAHEVMEYLSKNYPKAHDGLLEHLNDLYERYGAPMRKQSGKA